MTADVALLGGTYSFAPDLRVHRLGYGAMQLAGRHVFGPPKDRALAIRVLREAVERGVDHIDTSDYYGPHVTNQIIKEALHPYPAHVHIVTKVGARRDERGGWPHARSPRELRDAVVDNLRNLELDVLDVVNFRVGGFNAPEAGSVAEGFSALADMQREGLIRHLGVSNVSAEQIAEAQAIAPVACVQNFYNVANRDDDALIESLARQQIAYVPFFPLGGFTPLQSAELDQVANRRGVSAQTIALAWLLQRSPNILVIPGTSSIEHLHENIAAAQFRLSDDDLDLLNKIASGA